MPTTARNTIDQTCRYDPPGERTTPMPPLPPRRRATTVQSSDVRDYAIAVVFDTSGRATIHQQPRLPATLRRAAAARLRVLADELDGTTR